MRELKCLSCGREWVYTGKHRKFASCPSCGKLVHFKKMNDKKVVSLEWLEKYVKKIVKMLSNREPGNDFDAGEISGKAEALEILLSAAKKEAEKR